MGARLDAAGIDAVRWGADGLLAGVVQDERDGRVLMVGHLDEEALRATLETGDVHFHSRSRDRLWRKGETSGNTLRLADAALDCDGDALLLTVDPSGPTCHTGTRSCFDPDGTPVAEPQGFAWLETLWTTIEDRASHRPAGSYTAGLLEGGVDAAARKIGEEAVEVVIAAKDDAASSSATTRQALAGEMADLVFHVLVLCVERGLPPAELLAVLRERRR